MKYRLKQWSTYIVFMVMFTGCTMISPFSEVAYKQSTSIKATALLLMTHATEPYSKYSQSVESLGLEVHKAYEYARARPKNEESTKQWEIILDTKGHSLSGFMKRWRVENTLEAFFIQEAKKEIAKHFDMISTLESEKEE